MCAADRPSRRVLNDAHLRRQEEPDPTADPDLDEPRSRSDHDDDEASNESDEFFDDDEIGDERSGPLLAEDESYSPDRDLWLSVSPPPFLGVGVRDLAVNDAAAQVARVEADVVNAG
jgi:hypothetical protein